jgi:hypothetical protein
MAIENFKIWHGTWRIETQHYRGKLIIGDKRDAAENDALNGNLVLYKEHHEEPEYNFCLSIPLQTVDTDKIVFSGRDRREGDEKSYAIEVLLVRYSHPTGAGNRAIGYFQLAAEPERPEGHKQPIEATKE